MARRTYSDYQASVVHALGGEPATGVSKEEIVNDAIYHLCTMREWYWRRGGPIYVSTLAPITISGGTWTESSKTLTKTGAFADYTFRVRDTIKITAGDNATTGVYELASKTDDDSVVLKNSIGSAADGDTDIGGKMEFGYVPLPSDVGEIVSAQYPDSFSRTMIATTLSVIEAYRANPITAANFSFHYALNTGYANLDTDPTTGLEGPRLELYPAPDSKKVGAIVITYLRDIPRSNNTADVPAIPEWMDLALDFLVRSFAMTLEDDNPNNSADMAFQKMLPNLVRRDRAGQRRLGVMQGGLWSGTGYADQFYPDTINDPS